MIGLLSINDRTPRTDEGMGVLAKKIMKNVVYGAYFANSLSMTQAGKLVRFRSLYSAISARTLIVMNSGWNHG